MSSQHDDRGWVPELRLRRDVDACCELLGPAARFYGSWEQLGKLINDSSILEALKNAPAGSSRRDAFSSVPSEAKKLHGVFRHELDHLRRLHGTTLGILLKRCTTEATRSGLELVQSCSSATEIDKYVPLRTNRIRLGLTEVSAIGLQDRFDQLTALDQAEQRAISSMALMKCLDARSEDQFSQSLTEFAVSLMPCQGKPFQASSIYDIELWTGQQSHLLLGSRNLMEFLACTEELSALGMLGADDVSETVGMIQKNPDYRVAYNWLATVYPDLSHESIGRMRDGDLMLDAYRIAPVEFYAAIDLALWPPLAPEGWDFTRSNCAANWTDIHPGLRWLTVIDAMKQVGTSSLQTPITADNRETVFFEIQQALCDALGWPTPSELAGKWVDALRSPDWAHRSEFLGPIDRSTHAILLSVLQTRVDRGFDAIMNNMDWNQTLNARFPCWIAESDDQLGIRVTNDSLGDPARGAYMIRLAILNRLLDDNQLHQFNPADRDFAVASIQRVLNLSVSDWQSKWLLQVS